MLRTVPQNRLLALCSDILERLPMHCSQQVSFTLVGEVQASLGNTLNDSRHDCNQHKGWIGSNAMLEPKIQRMLNWVVWYLVQAE